MSVSIRDAMKFQYGGLSLLENRFTTSPKFYRYGGKRRSASFSSVSMFFPKLFPMEGGILRTSESRASRIVEKLKSTNGDKSSDTDTDSDSENENDKQENNHHILDEKTKYELKKKIREALATKPDVEEELDPEKRKKMMEEFVSEHPLVVEEEDPTWTDEDDGWGFNLDQFFNKVTIKNVRKYDDEDYDSENEMVWEDDDFVRPIKDITTLEWEETVFKDISPLIVFVHNRYRRPEEDEKLRDELVKAVTIISDCNLPVPRCVALDALLEVELVDALGVSVYPELIFTKAGRILYREKAIRNADELSKIMAFFYYGAAKPPYLNIVDDSQETVPSAPRYNPHLL